MMRRLWGLSALALLLLTLLLSGCSVGEVISRAVEEVKAPPEDYVAAEDGFRYAKSQLSPQQQYLYDRLVEGIRQQEPEIADLYPDNEMICAAAAAIHRDYPEFFWFDGAGQIQTTLIADAPVSAAYQPQYSVSREERASCQQVVDQWTAACLSTIPAGATDYDKTLAIYRYIIDHTDYKTVGNNSILNVMRDGAGLCGCYAMTTQYLLNQAGVPCAYVNGWADNTDHAWNLVWLDGNPCWLDTTWGDPVFEGGSSTDGIAYDYFCITTADLLRTHTLDDKLTVPDCTCEDYNYYRHNGRYFDTYDWTALAVPVEQAVSGGESKVALRFSDAAYPVAKSGLFSSAQLYDLYQKVDADLGTTFSAVQRLTYTYNDTMGTITLIFPS